MRRLLSLILGCCLSLSVFAAKPRVVLATTTWSPYVQNNPIYKGYVYNIVQAAFKAAGYDVVIKFMPWDSAIHALNEHKVDGVFPKYYSMLDAQDMLFSDPLMGGPIVLYHRADQRFEMPFKNPAKHLDQLFAKMRDYKFGVVSGYHNLPAFDHNNKITKIPVYSDKQNLQQLYNGKVDFILIDHFTAKSILKNQFDKKIQQSLVVMPPALGHRQLHLVVSREAPDAEDIISAFNRGLTAIHKNGIMDKILDRDAHYTGHLLA